MRRVRSANLRWLVRRKGTTFPAADGSSHKYTGGGGEKRLGKMEEGSIRLEGEILPWNFGAKNFDRRCLCLKRKTRCRGSQSPEGGYKKRKKIPGREIVLFRREYGTIAFHRGQLCLLRQRYGNQARSSMEEEEPCKRVRKGKGKKVSRVAHLH